MLLFKLPEIPSRKKDTDIGSGKQVMIFALSLLIQKGLYRLGSLLLEDYSDILSKKTDADSSSGKNDRDILRKIYLSSGKKDRGISSGKNDRNILRKKIYLSSGKKDKNNILRDILIALLSGGLAATVSVGVAIWQWKTTNHRQQLTSYKETIIENLVFDDGGQGTNQLLYDEEKLNALRALTSDVLLKLDPERKQELVKFLENLRLLGGKRPELPGENDPKILCARELTKLEREVLGEKNPEVLCEKYPSLLAGIILKKINLSKAALNNADLSRSYLRGANLYRSVLRGADLQGANLEEADLRGANLRGTNLKDIKLEKTKLDGAIYDEETQLTRNQELQGSYRLAPESQLSNANLREADLSSANLREADLSGANLREADLRGANLRGAKLKNIKLEKAKLNGAIYDEETQLTRGQNLQGAYRIAPGSQLSNADLSGADLSGADLSSANLREADLSNAILTEAKVSDEVLKEVTLCNTIWIDGSIKNPQEQCKGKKMPYSLPGTSATDEPTKTTANLRNFSLFSNRF